MLACFFVANALVAEFIGVKIFALEPTLGLDQLNWFGMDGPLNFTAGVLLWPIVFIMTDIINEYYGFKAVKILSWLTASLITYAFIMVFMAINLSPASWWVGINQANGVLNMQDAFVSIFGQSNWIIVGSLIAFLLGQLIDALIFQKIRRKFGEKHIWLRATTSTLVSQLIDSFVVLYVAFVLGPQKWGMSLFLSVGTVNYAYKVCMALLLIPMLYVARSLIESYLGKEEALRLKNMSAGVLKEG